MPAAGSPIDLPWLVVACLALGVHATTGFALLVIGAESRRARWYVAFLGAMCVWLALLALVAAGASIPHLDVASALAAHALPGVFLAFALVQLADWPAARLLPLAALGLATAPFVLGGPWADAVVIAWHVVGWTTGMLLVSRTRPAPDAPPALERRRRALRIALAATLGTIALLVAASGNGNATVVIPLVSAVAQGLVLVGAVRLQLYGVARRAERAGAERAGAVARDAAELERLALLGELGAIVAHEVRNPLTGMRSLAQRLAGDEPIEPARRARFAALIVQEVDRLDRFVGSMLALARRDAGAAPDEGGARDAPRDAAPAATDAPALLDDLRALVAARAARRGVHLDARAALATIPAPRGPLAQVLLNLLLNAVAHAPADTTVALDVVPTPGGIACTVRDAGPGIPADRRATLFEPFAPGARGTGLGLAIVRRVCDAHGWTIAADDAPGGGTAMTVTIPAAAAAPNAPNGPNGRDGPDGPDEAAGRDAARPPADASPRALAAR